MTSEKGSSQPLLSMTGTQAAYKHTQSDGVTAWVTCAVFWLQDSTKRENTWINKKQNKQNGTHIKLLLLNARKAISLVTDTDSKSPAYRRLQINIHFTYTVTRHDSKYREGERKYVGWGKNYKTGKRGWGEKSEFPLKCRRCVEIEGWAAVVSDGCLT